MRSAENTKLNNKRQSLRHNETHGFNEPQKKDRLQ